MLAYEQQQLARADEASLAKIRVQLAELERVVLEPMFAELIAPFPEIMATWSHGVIVALRLGNEARVLRHLLPFEARSALIELRVLEALPRLGVERVIEWEHKLLVEARRRMNEPPPMAITRPLRRVARWLDGTWP